MHSDYLTQVLKKRNRLEVTCRDWFLFLLYFKIKPSNT
jgi:hypothetical protein